jgi:hypothetical protein
MNLSIEVGAVSTAIVAAVAALAGLAQYRKAEAWKRAQFTAGFLKQLSTDEELIFACKAIDWGLGPLIIPEKYRPLFTNREVVITHNWDDLANALKPNIDINVITNPKQLIYRYSVDALLDYFDQSRKFIELNLVRLHDLASLGYYAALIRYPIYYHGTTAPKDVFGSFVNRYYPELPEFLVALEADWKSGQSSLPIE